MELLVQNRFALPLWRLYFCKREKFQRCFAIVDVRLTVSLQSSSKSNHYVHAWVSGINRKKKWYHDQFIFIFCRLVHNPMYRVESLPAIVVTISPDPPVLLHPPYNPDPHYSQNSPKSQKSLHWTDSSLFQTVSGPLVSWRVEWIDACKSKTLQIVQWVRRGMKKL